MSQALHRQREDAAQALARQIRAFLPLVERIIDQAVRRVLQGETVSAQEKLASLYEPHTQIIRRGKAPPHETEFGHKVNYAEVEHGLISDWQVIAQGNPPDEHVAAPPAQTLPTFWTCSERAGWRSRNLLTQQ